MKTLVWVAVALSLGISTLGCGARPTEPASEGDNIMVQAGLPNGAKALGVFNFGDISIERYELANGLTLLYAPDHAAPIFSYQTWFKVGSRHEQPGKTGIAHLFEHLMFKGTKTHPEGHYDRVLEGLGARVNAATWLDWTFFYADVPAGHLDTVVALEADRVENLVLKHDPLESERKVVMNERLERVDNDPSGALSEALWSAAYTIHQYGHPTIGWMPDIEGLSLEDCEAFHQSWYAPNNAVIVVAGDVERKTLLQEITSKYGHLKRAELPAVSTAVEPRQIEARRAELKLAISAERLLLGYHAPAATSADHAALEVLNEVLFEGDSARLQRLLVTDGELAAGFYAFVPGFREPGLYEISVDMRPGISGETAEAVLLEAFAVVVEKGISDAELSKAKNKLETRFYRQLQTNQQRAQGLGYWAVTAEDHTALFSVAEHIAKVTLTDVKRVAIEVLRPEGRTAVFGRVLSDDET